MKIKEVVVVEGRDDTLAVTRAITCDTVETHGFGIRKDTWTILKKAYEERGLIIFTDPDCAGEEIRKKISEKFPQSKHAYLDREDATIGDDVGIENASDEVIKRALEKAKAKKIGELANTFELDDLVKAGLVGVDSSKRRRQLVGKELGIGYGNSNSFLKKLNSFEISKEEFEKTLKKIGD